VLDRTAQFVHVHGHRELDGRVEFGELEFDALDDQPMVIRDQYPHIRSPWHRGIPPLPVYPFGNIAAVGAGSNTPVPARTV
jgi:hypothetical protein